ncbi:MAG TPA: SRPBCC family protein [Gammaproteobacteria bacterium]
MFKKIAIVIAVLVAAWLAYAATRPDTFRFERTIVIDAPAPEIFSRINDFHAWRDWSPWEGLDLEVKREYSGADFGEGAAYAWKGNGNVGAGRMEITESSADSRIVIALHFQKPFEAQQFAQFTLEPEGDATRVTWTLHGPTIFVWKLLGLFMDFDKMIGGMLETGLADLKSLVETGAQPAAAPVNNGSI